MHHTFTFVFLAAVALTLGLRLWLGLRQLQHVATHRARVPAEFAERITLAEHHKAAGSYPRPHPPRHDRNPRRHRATAGADPGGRVQACADLLHARFADDSYLFGLGLFALVSLVGFVIDLPFTL